MRLSEVRGERVFDVIADIIGPTAEIAASEEMQNLLSMANGRPNVNIETIKTWLPSLLKAHRRQIVEILASVGGVTPEEYLEEMTLPSLMSDVVELLTDDVFTDFFTSAAASKGSSQRA